MIYAWPQSLKDRQLHQLSAKYVEPIFTQRWSMFAPCPTINAAIEVKYLFANGDSTDWFRPTERALGIHSKIPATHYGELVLAEANLDYWLSVDLDEMGLSVVDDFPSEQYSRFQKGYSYYKIRSYLRGWAQYLFDKRIICADIRFKRIDVTNGQEGVVILPTYTFKEHD